MPSRFHPRYHGHLPLSLSHPFPFRCVIAVRVDEGSLVTEKASGPSQKPRDVLESSGSIVRGGERACRSLTRLWPSKKKNPFFFFFFTSVVCKARWANEGHTDVSFLPLTCLRAKAFFPPFLLTEHSGLVFTGKKPLSSSCSFLYLLFRLGLQRKVISLSLSLRESTQWSCIEFLLQHFFLGSISDP